MSKYVAHDVEKKWQEYWKEKRAFAASIDSQRQKFYVLSMFPYPSGKIHMGHARNYIIADVIARYKKAMGYNVLHPMGWDAFGLPAENAAILHNEHPKKWTYENISTMKKQIEQLGISYDWDREIVTCSPDYYKHEQAMFIDFYNADLAYQKEAIVNWDPVDQTVLANEQVENGRGWRSGAIIEQRKLKQWFLRITNFADELLDGLGDLKGWPEKIKLMQHHWIGKSEGVTIKFSLADSEEGSIEVYSTRPETIFGASFIAVSPHHPILSRCQDIEVQDSLKQFNAATFREDMDKIGIRTSLSVLHPFDRSIKLPVYVANFVLMEYGSGAIFGCPAHDVRDHEFAKKYHLNIIQVVKPTRQDHPTDVENEAYTDDGILFNSRFLDGLDTVEAKRRVIRELERLQIGTSKTQYRLRDWGVSRQRYWGCPIPMIYCKNCGVLPVPKYHLPVTLPDDVSFEGGNPLSNHPTWKHVKCHICGSDAERETDTFDTFVESSWYFARFCSPNAGIPFTHRETEHWLPVDQYVGGAEHAVMHLLYARFFTLALNRLQSINLREPFVNLLNQGMISHETYRTSGGAWIYPDDVIKTGEGIFCKSSHEPVTVGRVEKMSKSKKNVIEPEEMILKYGADTIRLFLLSDSPPDRDLEWSEDGIDGASKYLTKLYQLVDDFHKKEVKTCLESDDTTKEKVCFEALCEIHRTIKDVTNLLENLHFNKVIARVRELTNYLKDHLNRLDENTVKQALTTIIALLYPIAPHIAEELHEKLGGTTALTFGTWPQADSHFLEKNNVVLPVQINGKIRGSLTLPTDVTEVEALAAAKTLPNVESRLADTSIKRVIYVPNKIINIVI
ncbi:leucine--tRNA ligase [Rickettsiales endosymbiont of Peranema trichophorum]|uniref:leucine--tRNA ligase n=1 Tax=Rickettsiales endosymbiont of Peranema trichophorum TaxID=2486577 RepID=UPI001023CB2C|nr:leucine--tRNA ligase [Rickettsiales endosymbiont of Peranema trichophorum]RZI47534.1 leucine--tRNA ligase [Rickettsiales endosymbiont of Peranema trichophorum]